MNKEKTWLDKICYPLEHPKYPQIKGSLIKRDEYGKITGKCAEGEIACYNKLPLENEHDSLPCNLLKLLGIPEDLLSFTMPGINPTYNREEKVITLGTNDWPGDNIGSYIVVLNDYGFTYPK